MSPMKIYLAVIAPDHDNATIIGAFSTLDAAHSAFSDDDPGFWEFMEKYQEWWQRNGNGIGYSDNEIHVLTLDEAKVVN